MRIGMKKRLKLEEYWETDKKNLYSCSNEKVLL